jgi:hypothetical protein
MSSSAAFDTLAYANRLKQGGFPEKQAEILAEVQSESLKELIDEKLATKHDIELVRKDIVLVKRDIKEFESSTKKEIELIRHDMKELEEKLRAEINEMGYKMTIRLGGMLIVGIGVIAILMKIL